MKKTPYFNDTDHMVFVGGVMVPPSETRLVDGSLIAAATAAAEQNDNAPEKLDANEIDREKLAELLKNKQEDVLKALPDLNLAETEALGELEQVGQARKGILGAVAERLLASAAEQQ